MLAKFLKSKIDPVSAADRMMSILPEALPKDSMRRRVLDVLLNVGIPFNRWLGLRIAEFSPSRVVIVSPPTVLRRNHVGTAHACAQALIGEYAAGLLVGQRFPMEKYRFIIGKLEIDYAKAGSGVLRGIADAPAEWPTLVDEEGWVEMTTRLLNEKDFEIAKCVTRWQVKSWAKIEKDRAARS